MQLVIGFINKPK